MQSINPVEQLRQEVDCLPRLEDGSVVIRPDLLGRLIQQMDDLANGFNQASEAIIATSPDFTIRTWNRAAEGMYGWSAGEALGRTMGELVPTRYPTTTRQRVLQDFQEKGFWNGEVLQQRKDGSTIQVQSSISTIKNSLGQPTTLVAINRDISGQKQAEEGMRLSEERFFKAFAASPNAQVISRQSDGQILVVNDSFERLFGYRREEVIGKTSLDLEMFANPADRQEAVRRLRKEEVIRGFELAIRTRSGEIRQASLSVVKINVGREAQMLTILQDITERKQVDAERERLLANIQQGKAEAEQRAEELNAILDTLHDPVLVYGLDGTILRANRAAAQAHGFDPTHHNRDGTNRTLKVQYADESVAASDELPSARALRGEVVVDERMIVTNAAGRALSLLVSSAPLRVGGVQAGAVSVWHDITDLVRAEDALQASEMFANRVLSSSLNGLYLFDVGLGKIVFINPQYTHLTGFTLEDLQAMPSDRFLARFYPDDLPRVIEHIQSVHQAEEGQVREIEYRFQRADGTWIWAYSYESVFSRRPDGRVEQYIGTFIDITERKRAEEQRRESEERFRRAVLAAPYPLMIRREDGRVVMINEAWTQMTGYTLDDIPTIAAWAEKAYEGRAPQAQATILIEGFSQEGVKRWGEYEVTTRWGEKRTWDFSTAPLGVDPEGRGLVMAMAVDVTERKQTEKALQEAHDRAAWLARFPEENPNPVARISAEGQILYCNPVSTHLFGWSCDTGKRLSTVLSTLVQQAMADGQEIERDVELNEKVYTISIMPFPQDGYANLYGLDITERKHAEEQRRESEERYRELFETMQEGLVVAEVITDETGSPVDYRYLDVNPVTERQFGLSREQFVGRTFTEVLPDADPEWIQIFGRVALTGDPESLERYGVVTGLWFHCHVYSPRPGQVVNILTDITDRKQAEEALRESEARFRQLADAMPQLVWTANPDGTVDYYNRRYQEFSGIAPVEGDPWQWSPVLHPDDLQPTVEAWRQAVQTGQVYQVEHRVHMADGSYRWHLSRGVPARDAEGRVVKWFGTATDIHDFKQAEQARQESDERLRVALDNAPITVFTQDRDLRFTWVYQPQSGVPPEAILGKRDDELMPREDVAEAVALKQAVISSGQGVRKEVRMNTHRGWQLAILHLEPLVDVEGDVVGLIGSGMDVTELRQAEEEARQNQTRLEVQHRLIEQREQERLQIGRDLHDGPIQNLAVLSFDLSAAAQMARDPRLEAAIQAAIETVRGEIQELRGYISDLRPPLLVKFGLAKAIQAHADTLREKNPAVQIDLELDGEAHPLPENVRLSLYRIYQEAVNNSLKHAQASEVRVHFGMQDHAATLVIRDNGKGFALPKQWLDLAREGHLGLVGMRERAEAVGGTLQIHSRPGQGTTLQVQVPVADPPSP